MRSFPPRSSLLSTTVILFATGAVVPEGLSGQAECPDGGISRISIENHSIFDPATMPESGGLLWAYRLANKLHIATRQQFIEKQLLFQEGDCVDRGAILESARILRQYRFISRADVYTVPVPDGTEEVVVDTRDQWSTKIALNLRFEDRIEFDGVSIFEENLLGRGITLGFFHVDRKERRDAGIALEVPQIGAQRIDARIVANRTRIGSGVEQELIHPFEGETSTVAFRQAIRRREDLFAYALPEDDEFTHVVLPLDLARVELSGARRFGTPGRLLLVGGGLSYERVSVGDTGEAEGVRGADFGTTEPVGGEYTTPLISQMSSREALRLNLLLGIRRLSFAARRGFDAVDGIQDLPVGREVLLSVGRTLGHTGFDRPGDYFSRIDVLHGFVGERQANVVSIAMEGRLEDPISGASRHWRDVLLEGHGFLYLAGPDPRRHTLLLRGAFHAGWRTTSPFQLTLGGADGVRSYSERELPGGRRAVVSIEDRIRLGRILPQLIDLGITVFADMGRIWQGGAPFGIDSDWRGALGAGLRVGFPPGSSTVIRADLAFPVGPGSGGRTPLLRIEANEWLGVLNEFRSPRVERARRGGVHGRYVGVGRERALW